MQIRFSFKQFLARHRPWPVGQLTWTRPYSPEMPWVNPGLQDLLSRERLTGRSGEAVISFLCHAGLILCLGMPCRSPLGKVVDRSTLPKSGKDSESTPELNVPGTARPVSPAWCL